MSVPVSLELSCLGQFQARVDGDPIRFATDHGRALIAYLAVEADRSHARAYLAFLLWPDHPESHALNNLRQTLIRLRQSFGMGEELAAALQITPKTIQFNSDATLFDVTKFQTLLAQCYGHNHQSAANLTLPQDHRGHGFAEYPCSLEQCGECLQKLEQAAELYKGEFLQGLSLRHSQPFNEWATYVREELHHQLISVLHTLALYYEEQGEFGRARAFVARQLTLEPWQEEAHRQLMRILAKGGQRSAAILQYETCRRLLYEELGVAPSSETTLLYERIRADTFDRVSELTAPRAANSPVQARSRWSDLPAASRLFGRHAELAQLEKWLIQEHSQLITVLGMGGIGKTAITTSAVESAARHYDLLLWRSLLNAPTLDEILRDWLGLMAVDSLAELPNGLDAQLALLLHHLRERRCLLILDNLESIFHADQAGHVRPEYAGFAQLFQQMAQTKHKSCLVLTSREQVQGVRVLNEGLPWVRTLQLEGLDAAATQSLLMARELTIQESQAAALANHYSGNPLAIKLVAETIQEVFDGNVSAFLSFDALIFEDIGAVLDQQFGRLPPLEQEILLWLAVEREPVSLETLRENLAPTRPAPEVIQALRALQRRSLLQRANRNPSSDLLAASAEVWKETRFAAPNVILEYLVNRLVQTICQEIEGGELHWLHAFSLMQAQAKEYVRQSQVRLILQPIANYADARLGRNGVIRKALQILNSLRAGPFPPRSYAAGNLINLLLLLEIEISALDLSGLAIWQADLRHANLANINLAGADVRHSRFADAFGIVHTVAVSPNGAIVAAGTNSGEIRLWNSASGQLIHIYPGHRGPVRSVAFSPNGKALASAGEDHRVRLWNVGDVIPSPFTRSDPTTGNLVEENAPLARICEGHSGRVMTVAFHPNGKMLASASVDGTVRLWDVVSGETRAVLHGSGQAAWALAFSPDGSILASSDVSGMIRLWDPQPAELRTTLVGHTMMVASLAFDPTGQWLASGGHECTIRIWDVASGEGLQALEVAKDAVTSVSFSPDGAILATSGDDCVIHLWETATWSHAHQLMGHKDAICGLVFSPDGRTLVSGGVDHMVALWDLHTARIHHIFSGYSRRINSLAFHPDGKLLVSGHYDRSVRLWDIEKKSMRQSLHGHTLAVSAVAFSNDGSLLASASDDKSIQVWEMPAPRVESGEEEGIRRRFQLRGHQRDVTGIVFQPDGKTLLSSSEDTTVGVWDLQNGQPSLFIPVGQGPIWHIKLNPAGTLAATISDHTIRLWEASSGELHKELRGHANFIWSIALSPTDPWLVSGGSDGSIALWDIDDPANAYLKTTWRGHSERVFMVAFSPDGTRIASTGADRTVCLWDVKSEQLIHTFKGHSNWVGALAFSPDGRTLASGGMDETICLWDTESGESIAVLQTPGPYADMNISGVTGLSEAERAILRSLGAVEK